MIGKLEKATGGELTELGELYGVLRINGECDSSYRQRVQDAADVAAGKIGKSI